VPGAYRRIAAFATAETTKISLFFRDIKGAEGGAPRDLIVLIDGVEHFVGETIDLLPIMQDMTGSRRRIVANIGMKLNDGKFAGGNPLDQLVLIEPA
jgi:hypothetical protein